MDEMDEVHQAEHVHEVEGEVLDDQGVLYSLSINLVHHILLH